MKVLNSTVKVCSVASLAVVTLGACGFGFYKVYSRRLQANKLKVEEEEEKINDKSDEVEKGRMSGGQQNVGMVAEVVEVQQKPAPTPAPIPAPTDKTTKLLEPCDRTLAKLNDLKQRLNLLRDDTELASLDNRINKLMGVFNENKLAIKNLREEYSSNIPV